MCGSESNTAIFQCDSGCEDAGKEKGLAAERGCRSVLSSSPELIHPEQRSENPTAAFVVYTLRAHSHRSTQTKQCESHRCLRHSHTPSSFAPQHSDEDGDNPTAVFVVPTYCCKPVTLAAQSSVIPTAVLLHPLPTTAPFEANTPAGGGVIPSAPHHCAHTLYLYYPAPTILQLIQDTTTASSVQKSIDIFRLIHSFAPSYKIKCDYCHIGPSLSSLSGFEINLPCDLSTWFVT